MFAQFDTAVMGRKTFLNTLQLGGSGAMPGLDVAVFSRTLRPADYPAVSIVDCDPAESVRSLRVLPCLANQVDAEHTSPVPEVRDHGARVHGRGYIPRLSSPICTSSRWVTRNPVVPSVSTADRDCDVTSVPFTRKRTWELPTSMESVFLDRP